MWIHNNKEFTREAAEEKIKGGFIGFVYIVTEVSTDKKYIGKKNLTRTIVRPPLKGKKRKRREVVQSDWESYYGSSSTVKDLVELGEEFRREILHFCRTKTELTYMEAKEQFDRNVLLDDSYYNDFIGCKIRGSFLPEDLKLPK